MLNSMKKQGSKLDDKIQYSGQPLKQPPKMMSQTPSPMGFAETPTILRRQ